MGSHSPQFSLSSVNDAGALVGLTVPREIVNDPRQVAPAPDANSYQLKRGQFRLTFRVPEPEPDIDIDARLSSAINQLTDKLLYAQTKDGPKRIYAYSITQEPGPVTNGEETLTVRATFTVIDNFVWIVPALYALTAAISTIGGWFLIDKVESFSGTAVGSITTVIVVALTGFVLFKAL